MRNARGLGIEVVERRAEEVKNRIRLIMPRGSAAKRRLTALVRAQGGRVLRVQEWLRTSEVSVAEVLVLLKKGAAGLQLRASLEGMASTIVLDMHSVSDARRGREC